MQRLDIYSSLFMLLFAIYVALTSTSLELGTLGRPGPGFFPFGGAVIVGVNAVIILSKALSKRAVARVSEAEKTRWWNVACVLGAIVVFALLVNTLGFILCTFLMFVFFLRVVTLQRWPKTMIVALCAAIGSYVIFDVLLNAPLPKGFLTF
jgi:putative tricarboxylic transport membrane protein